MLVNIFINVLFKYWWMYSWMYWWTYWWTHGLCIDEGIDNHIDSCVDVWCLLTLLLVQQTMSPWKRWTLQAATALCTSLKHFLLSANAETNTCRNIWRVRTLLCHQSINMIFISVQNHPSIHSSIFFHSSRVGFWWQQVKQDIPDVSLEFSRWYRYKSLQWLLGLPWGVLPVGCARKTSKPPWLASFNTKEQRLYSYLPWCQSSSLHR